MSFTTKEELHDAIYSYIHGDRSNGYIHHWDVSHITDMSNLFSDMPTFNEPISNWNVSNVSSMANMFYNCTYFNQDLSSWDVSRVTDMSRMFYKCSNFTGLSHKKQWSCISSWNTQNVYNMTSMLEGAILFTAKIRGWDVHNVVFCKDFSKNCCHMRHNLPQFPKHALSLSLLVPLLAIHETSLFDVENESPIITSANQLSPLYSNPVIDPLRYTPPYKLVSAASPLIKAAVQKLSPVPDVEYIGTKAPLSPDVEYIGTKAPLSLDVEYIGTKAPLSPDVEYIGTKAPIPSPVVSIPPLNFFINSEPPPVISGGYKRKTTKKNKSKKKSKKIKKNINDILATHLAY